MAATVTSKTSIVPMSFLPNKGFNQYTGENYFILNRAESKVTWEKAFVEDIRGKTQYAYVLSKMLQYGEEGVEKDIGKATSIHEQMIKEGNSFVSSHKRELARILMFGDGPTSRAKELLEESVEESGNNFARVDLAYLIRHNFSSETAKAKELLQNASEYDQDESFYALLYHAYMHEIAADGFGTNEIEKNTMIKQADLKLNRYIQKYFGYLVQNSNANLCDEFVWKLNYLETIASRQSGLLNFCCGFMFEHGGAKVPKNFDTATMFYEAAKNGGHKDAVERLDKVAEKKKEEEEVRAKLEAERMERIAERDAARRAAEEALMSGSGSSSASSGASDKSSNSGDDDE